MRRVTVLLASLFLLVVAVSVLAEPPAKDLKSKTAHLLEALSSPVSFPAKGDEDVIDQKTTLGEILTVLGDRYDVVFTVDDNAFREASNGEEMPVMEEKVLEKPFRKLVDVSLGEVLQHLLERVPVEGGATFVVDHGTVQLTTVAAQRARIWGKDYRGPYLPLIQANFERVPLTDALEDIARQGNVTLIVSDVLADKMRTPITTQLINAPLDTAALMLADIADCRPVFKDNLLYITTRDNAKRLEQEFQKRHRQAHPQPTSPPPAPIPDPEPMKPTK
jgi:hypothetical protein